MTEQISALVDDEIALHEALTLVATMQPNSQAADYWHQYHLIGDVMRGTQALSPQFKQNLMAKLELEPTVLSPNAATVNRHDAASIPIEVQINDELSLTRKNNKQAAIQSRLSMHWSIAASFAAVIAVGWTILPTQIGRAPTSAMLVQNTFSTKSAALNVAAEQTVPNEYLIAHQATAPSASSYYIQTVSYSE